jgi:HK97 family phage major capsid protein
MRTKDLHGLRERRNALAKKFNDVMDAHEGDKWNQEASDTVTKIGREIEEIDAQITTILGVIDKINAGKATDELREKHTRTPGAHSGDGEHAGDFRNYLRGGLQALGEDGRARLAARVNDDVRQAFALPQAAMSTTTGSEGGFTVATEYMRELEVALLAFGGILAAARIINTGTGATMNFPTADATAEEGEIVGQNVLTTALDTAFGNKTMEVYKYSSKSIAIPWELIQDSFIDIEAYVRDLIQMRVGRVTSKHFTVGTGTGQPFGIVPQSLVGRTGTTGQTTTVIYDDLVFLEHSVDPAYRGAPGVGFMMHDNSLSVVRRIKDSQGRPIFVPGYEQGNPGGAPDRLLNRPIFINQQMAVMAANAKSILFGDFRKYIVRRVMDLTLFRMTDSAFTLKGQVGFVAFNRQGGNLIDAGGAVKHYANSAT